jgi:hypothetical protein
MLKFGLVSFLFIITIVQSMFPSSYTGAGENVFYHVRHTSAIQKNEAYKSHSLSSLPNKLLKYVPDAGTVILIDFRLPSNKKRLWVIQDHKILVNCRVAHGIKSGRVKTTHFSNQHESNMSCIGTFLTGDEYQSEQIGRAMYLHGMDKGVNDNAFQRGIRFHASTYLSDAFLKKNGRIGRSLGCFTTEKKYNDIIIDVCKSGTLVHVIANTQGK